MVGRNSKAGKIVRYILTTLLMLIMIYPFIYLVLNSFAAWDQVDKKLIPTEFTMRSWDWLFGNSVVAAPAPWIHAFINTVIVSTIATGLMLLFGLMVGYALAKVDFKGKRLVNNAILFQMFFPAIILLIPQFLMITDLGMLDTYAGMIIPTMLSLWAVFMYANFFKAIPDTLIEAAKLDGASDLKILFRVVLPMSKSITTVIFLFLFTDKGISAYYQALERGDSLDNALEIAVQKTRDKARGPMVFPDGEPFTTGESWMKSASLPEKEAKSMWEFYQALLTFRKENDFKEKEYSYLKLDGELLSYRRGNFLFFIHFGSEPVIYTPKEKTTLVFGEAMIEKMSISIAAYSGIALRVED